MMNYLSFGAEIHQLLLLYTQLLLSKGILSI